MDRECSSAETNKPLFSHDTEELLGGKLFPAPRILSLARSVELPLHLYNDSLGFFSAWKIDCPDLFHKSWNRRMDIARNEACGFAYQHPLPHLIANMYKTLSRASQALSHGND